MSLAPWWNRFRRPGTSPAGPAPEPVDLATIMRGKTVLVTGSTDGIGRETALQLAQRGARVFVHARSRERGEPVLAGLRAQVPGAQSELAVADFASLAQVRQMAADLRARIHHLDVLLNNAGIKPLKRVLSADGFELTFAVNHLAHFLLTNLLLDLVRRAPEGRILTVSSVAHHRGAIHFDDLQGVSKWDSYVAYAQSKLANVLFAFKLARLLDGTSVTSNALHPGVVTTKLLVEGFDWHGVDVSEGAATAVYLASSPEVAGINGKYWGSEHQEKPARACNDQQAQDRLWDLSEQMVGRP